MKKFLALLLAIVMTCALVIGVSASSTPDAEDETQVVQVNVETEATGTVYSVDVAWGSLVFTYKDATAGTWQPADHSYANVGTDGWKTGEGVAAQVSSTVTVTNHSNADVTIKTSYENEADTKGVTVSVTGESTAVAGKLLTAGVVGEYDTAANTTINVTVSGTPTITDVDGNVTIGTITVTVE